MYIVIMFMYVMIWYVCMYPRMYCVYVRCRGQFCKSRMTARRGSLALTLTSDVLCVLNMGAVRRREFEHWVVECEDERAKAKG